MKFFSRYNQVSLLATILIFLCSSVCYYFLISYLLVDQIDDDLLIEKSEVTTYLSRHGSLPAPIPVADQIISYAPATDFFEGNRFFNTRLYDPVQKESNLCRQLRFCVWVQGRPWQVSVSNSLEETSSLIRSILLITLGTILLILLTSLLINRRLVRKLWQPFYDTLIRVKSFQIDGGQRLDFAPSPIEEFNFMNDALKEAVNRASRDYHNLKAFTENASHEMQTPLAIIRSKLDLLIQDEKLSENQSQTVQRAYEAIHKLSRLNQSLLLLAKIENNQFDQREQLDLKEKMEQKLEAFQELLESQHISLSLYLEPAPVQMNAQLADILLNNLLSNATRHNYAGGRIAIRLCPGRLHIHNTGPEQELDKDRMFQRFYKSEAESHSNGLGLSIVEQICQVSGFSIWYSFSENLHRFEISWPA